MNAAVVEKKPATIVAKDAKPVGADNQPETKQPVATTPAEKAPAESLRDSIAKLDAERTAMVKDAIENLKPGKPFDSAVVRNINKIETKKNRLIVSRFAALLRKGGPEIQTIVHQIIEI